MSFAFELTVKEPASYEDKRAAAAKLFRDENTGWAKKSEPQMLYT